MIHFRNAFIKNQLHASGTLMNIKHLRPPPSGQLNKWLPIEGADLAGGRLNISHRFFFLSFSSAPLFERECRARGDRQFWPGDSGSLGFWTPQPVTLLGGFWLQKDWGMSLIMQAGEPLGWEPELTQKQEPVCLIPLEIPWEMQRMEVPCANRVPESVKQRFH